MLQPTGIVKTMSSQSLQMSVKLTILTAFPKQPIQLITTTKSSQASVQMVISHFAWI